MSGKLSEGIQTLREQGHQIDGRIQFDKMWWEVDRRMLATPEEIEHIADSVYSLSKLEGLYLLRRRDEADATR